MIMSPAPKGQTERQTDMRIPIEAVEAACRAALDAGAEICEGASSWDEADEDERNFARQQILSALLAAEPFIRAQRQQSKPSSTKSREVTVICRYFLTIRCACPVDGTKDLYWVVIKSPSMVPVELFLDYVRETASKKQFQEELTADLAKRFGCEVETRGFHSGVYTVVSAP